MNEKEKSVENLQPGKMSERLALMNRIKKQNKINAGMKLEGPNGLKNIFNTFKTNLCSISGNDFAKGFEFDSKDGYILKYKGNSFGYKFDNPNQMIGCMVLSDYVIKILQSTLSRTNAFMAYPGDLMYFQGETNAVDPISFFRKQPLSEPVMNYDFVTAFLNGTENQVWSTDPTSASKYKLYSDTKLYTDFAQFVVNSRKAWGKIEIKK